MDKTLRLKNVFIASPGDVSDARDCVRKAVERVNRLVAKPSGILLEAVGWEDIPSGKGKRTQDVINPYVDAADMFIGVLNRRFGNPTGIAESGTEEEYNRIEKRWQEEDPKPEITVYFKRLPQDALSDPGDQLRRVLVFKNRISETLLYNEFEGTDDLGEKVEDALAGWIHRHREPGSLISHRPDVEILQPTDLRILVELIQHPDAGTESIQSVIGCCGDEVRSSLARLESRGLVTEHHQRVRPSNSTEGFLSIAKYLISSAQWRSFLQSDYYNRMLNANIRELVGARFHYSLDEGSASLLRKLALLSPASASYVLFGDTSLYDNLAEHARTLGQEHVSWASEMMKRSILLHVLLRYADDLTNARTLDILEGQPIAGQLITLRVAAAYDTGRAFDASLTAPIMRARAATDIEKGQMVFGPPALLVQTATILAHMGEFDLALKEFDEVLNLENPAIVRAAALNNKGLILLNRHQVPQAIELFREAADLAPELPEPRRNFSTAESLLAPEAPDQSSG